MNDYTYQLNSPSIFPWSAIVWAIVGIAVVLFVLWLFKKYFEYKRRWEVFLQNRNIPSIVANLSGQKFEVWVQQLFLSLGIPAEVVGRQGDHGIDVIAKYKGKVIGVQCKKYDRWLVGEPTLRDLYGAQRHGNFDEVLLITTGNLSREALAWAKGKKDLKLVNGNLLGKIIADRRLLLDLLDH